MVEHYLQIEIIAEDFLEPLCGLFGFGEVAVRDVVRDLARKTRRRNYKSSTVFFEQKLVYSRLVVEAVDVRH